MYKVFMATGIRNGSFLCKEKKGDYGPSVDNVVTDFELSITRESETEPGEFDNVYSDWWPQVLYSSYSGSLSIYCDMLCGWW